MSYEKPTDFSKRIANFGIFSFFGNKKQLYFFNFLPNYQDFTSCQGYQLRTCPVFPSLKAKLERQRRQNRTFLQLVSFISNLNIGCISLPAALPSLACKQNGCIAVKKIIMLLSMTGYGRATNTFNSKVITAEIRALNSKFTDIRLKIPSGFREKEHALRRHITERVERGKVDINIEIKSLYGDDSFGLNVPLFKRYYTELSRLAEELNAPTDGLIQAILRIPNVIVTEEAEIDENEWLAVENTFKEALINFDDFRKAEGSAMEEDLRLRLGNILTSLKEVNPFETERITLLRNRMRQNLEEFMNKENIDENRFEQEVIFYLEKIDITEEKVRLEQHCNYFLEQLNTDGMSKGRTLSFISQEMGREINTLGAKAYSADIQRLVVRMKDDLEKIKEQVANSV